MAVISGGNVIDGALARPYQNAGAPTSGASGTLIGVAKKGDLLVDTTNGKLYICTVATVDANFAWTVAGTQT